MTPIKAIDGIHPATSITHRPRDHETGLGTGLENIRLENHSLRQDFCGNIQLSKDHDGYLLVQLQVLREDVCHGS
jgi:hypothetical protein